MLQILRLPRKIEIVAEKANSGKQFILLNESCRLVLWTRRAPVTFFHYVAAKSNTEFVGHATTLDLRQKTEKGLMAARLRWVIAARHVTLKHALAFN